MRPAAATEKQLPAIKALVFDVYGTCVDYWSTIVSQGEAISRKLGVEIDWQMVTREWAAYPPSFTAILQGKRAWESFAALRRASLEEILRRHGISGLGVDDIDEIDAIWLRLQPWADTRPGLQRLKNSFLLATLGNADMADIVRLVKANSLPFDAILTAELARSVKPDPKVYALAPQFLALQPDEIMMVACHKVDLHGARAAGLRTAFVSRPAELGPIGKLDTSVDEQFDLNCGSFEELAGLMGA